MKALELKLIVPAGRRAALVRSLGLAKAPKVLLEAHYFDTADHRLRHAGMSLRVRKEGDAWIQTLKSATKHAASRVEDSVVVPGTSGVPRPDLDRHAGRQAGNALRKVLGASTGADLHEVYRTLVTRRYITRKLKTESIEIAFDEGVIQAHGQELAVCEVELELKSNATTARQLFSLARRLVREHGLWLSTLSKADRGAQLSMAPDAAPPAVKAEPVRFKANAPAGRQFRAMVDNCLAQMAPNASHIAAGSADADQVHQLRVGIRRLRTVLREAAALVSGIPAHWEPSLRSVFQALGAHRDQVDVGESIKPQLEAAGAPLAVPGTGATGAPTPQEAVRSLDFQAVLLECLAFTRVHGHGADTSARKVLRKRLGALHEKVLAEGGRFSRLDADRQHRVRKRLKRLRYISELSAPLFGEKKVARFLAELRPAQDALGDHHDGLVALEGFKARTKRDGRAWFGVGWLTANQAQTADQCKRHLKKLRRTEPFW